MSTTEVVRTEKPEQALARILTAGRRQIEMAVGKAMEPERMIRLAVTALNQTPALQECSMISICNSVMLAAQLRLEINTSLGHAWLIPYKRVCTFQPGYRGLIELAHRSGEVHDVSAHVVYEKDVFELEYGDRPRLFHKPHLSRDRGAMRGAYAVVRYNEGEPSSLFMLSHEIEEIRDRCSQSWNSAQHKDMSPWVRFPEEMIRKTPTKRHMKYIRLSVKELSRAIGLDDQADAITNGEPRNPAKLDQEMVLSDDLLDMAEVATHELRGSQEQVDQVRDAKLEQARNREQRAGGSAPAEQRDFTPDENRTLDAEIQRKEKAQQGPPTASPRRKLF